MIVNFIRGTFKLMKSMDFFMETCFFVFFKVPNIYFGKTVISAQIKNISARIGLKFELGVLWPIK